MFKESLPSQAQVMFFWHQSLADTEVHVFVSRKLWRPLSLWSLCVYIPIQKQVIAPSCISPPSKCNTQKLNHGQCSTHFRPGINVESVSSPCVLLSSSTKYNKSNFLQTAGYLLSLNWIVTPQCRGRCLLCQQYQLFNNFY